LAEGRVFQAAIDGSPDNAGLLGRGLDRVSAGQEREQTLIRISATAVGA